MYVRVDTYIKKRTHTEEHMIHKTHQNFLFHIPKIVTIENNDDVPTKQSNPPANYRCRII